jgi:hypothetical protein
MPFTGKATYSAGATLPEIAEDVSDIISLVSPHETPLLDHLGDAQRSATSTIHEWLEDALLPNTDAVDDDDLANPTTLTEFTVANGDRFQVGDQIMLAGKEEVMLVTAIDGDDLTVEREYGGSTAVTIEDGDVINIIGNAALEGDDAPAARFTNRVRKQNYTQIFTASVEVSGSQLASQTIGLADEMDYQKQERLRELLRDLENCVINGMAPPVDPQGSSTVRRSMRGVIASITTNVFEIGADPIPAGDGLNGDQLNEAALNAALRAVWEQSSGSIDTIVCGGYQKRRINGFIAASQRFAQHTTEFSSMVDIYESDYGVCRVVLCRWMPADKIVLLDSSRIAVLPLSARSFHFKPLASSGDSETGQIIGEYTLEFRNENTHAVLQGLATVPD